MSRGCTAAMALVAVLAFSAGPAWAAAEEPEPAAWAYRYFEEVMSPFCPGRTLDSCTSSSADSLRMWILVQEAAGRSQADVHEELIERYGDVILAAPRAKGFGITAYAIPAGFFLAGGLLVFVYLRRKTRSAVPLAESAAAEPIDPELERIIDEELDR